MRILASSIGSPANPTNLANTFKSVKRLNNITDKTIETYIGYLTDAFLIGVQPRLASLLPTISLQIAR